MNREFTILVVGDQPGEILGELRKIRLVPLHLETTISAHLSEAVVNTHPQLVIFENGNPDPSVLPKMVNQLMNKHSGCSWAVTGKHVDIDALLTYFRMGAIDFLKQPVAPEDVKKLIQKLLNLESSAKSDQNQEIQRSLAFFSTKGGVGLTTLAVNTAVELAAKNTGKVLLIDFVLQHGNVADFLDMPSKFTLLDMIENMDRLDSNLIENSLAKHASGLYVLPCPKQPEDEDFISPAQTTEILSILKRMFPYIVIDLGHEFVKTSIACLDFSDHIFLATTPDVPSLCNGRNAFGILNRMGYGAEKVKIVLNKWRMKGEINSDEIKKNLSMELFAQVPDDAINCLIAANQGKPVSQVAPKSEFIKGIRSLIAQLDHLKTKEVPHVSSRAA